VSCCCGERAVNIGSHLIASGVCVPGRNRS
jgi:hypothetical protein